MTDSDEVLFPPRGYCIGVFGHGQGDGIIGPFATEAQAREALADAIICRIGWWPNAAEADQ